MCWKIDLQRLSAICWHPSCRRRGHHGQGGLTSVTNKGPQNKKNCHNLPKTFDIPIDTRSVLEGRRWGDNIGEFPILALVGHLKWMWVGPERVWAYRSFKTNSDIQVSDMCFCTSLNLRWTASEDFGRVSKCRVHEDMTCPPEHSLLKIGGGGSSNKVLVKIAEPKTPAPETKSTWRWPIWAMRRC